MASKKCPPPPAARSPLQPATATNYSNVPATASGMQHAAAPSRCRSGGIKCVAIRSVSSCIVHIKLGDAEKVVGAVKLNHH